MKRRREGEFCLPTNDQHRSMFERYAISRHNRFHPRGNSFGDLSLQYVLTGVTITLLLRLKWSSVFDKELSREFEELAAWYFVASRGII